MTKHSNLWGKPIFQATKHVLNGEKRDAAHLSASGCAVLLCCLGVQSPKQQNAGNSIAGNPFAATVCVCRWRSSFETEPRRAVQPIRNVDSFFFFQLRVYTVCITIRIRPGRPVSSYGQMERKKEKINRQ